MNFRYWARGPYQLLITTGTVGSTMYLGDMSVATYRMSWRHSGYLLAMATGPCSALKSKW